MSLGRILSAALFLSCSASLSIAQEVLIEAESFETSGGWKLDTQSIGAMGSPYLLAHGLGQPVEDATTTVQFPAAGEYRVYVRTKDWVARWQAEGAPGKFQLLVNGQPLGETFGTRGAEWFWHDGGIVQIADTRVELALHDLTGFEGRCDAILFTKSGRAPPSNSEVLPRWRQLLLGLAEVPSEKNGYDLVVVGGGYSGMGAAISAARMGCKVALIQNRGVLGGNGSSEVRVWAQGLIRRGIYPRVGEIIEEICDHATKSPGTYEEFEDAKKERIVRAEKNIDLFLNHHAYQVETKENAIAAVLTFDTKTSEQKRFVGRNYVDCTGHGTIGFLAGAEWDMTPKGRMGMSNMWAWGEGENAVGFPETPWALDLEMEDFPYPRDHHGQWFWEGGFDKDPIGDAEGIRDWNLRAVYGAFNAMKNRGGSEQHKKAYLTWIAYIGGPRESRRLMGDVVLTQKDIVDKRAFADGCVPSTWSIDLHYPKNQYAKKFPDNPFISVAKFDTRVDRAFGYPLPYRCFYSRNIENLFMAGRCASVTHEALGTVRVMKTCGMMGEVVGRAASLCVLHNCSPREVYYHHWPEMAELLRLPGKAWRETVDGELHVPADSLPLAGRYGVPTGVAPDQLAGTVVDDREAEWSGKWTESSNLKGYVGWGYHYASSDSGAVMRFHVSAPSSGKYEVRLAYREHENRGNAVPVSVEVEDKVTKRIVNMRERPPLEHGFVSLGQFELQREGRVTVVLETDDAGGAISADAVQMLRIE